MKRIYLHHLIIVSFGFLLFFTFFCSSVSAADKKTWQRKEVNWRISGDRSIKAIKYPSDKPPLTLNKHRRTQARVRFKEIVPSPAKAPQESASGSVFAAVIDSPPLDGFVPWIVVSITDERDGHWEMNAVPNTDVIGDPLTENPQSDYVIGIYDTGASINLISDDHALKTGIAPDLVTSLETVLGGATGSAIGYNTQPLGVFIAGLDSLEPNGLLLDNSKMVGETNVSIVAGDPIESPNLPTVIGMPMGVYFSSAFCNNKQISVTLDGNDFNSPYIDFYSLSDSCTPSYSNLIDLQLRPTDALAVQYFPCDLVALCGGEPDGSPVYPSMFWGVSLIPPQSLYYLPWVNVADGDDSINNIDGFMLDTGAQVTVISRTVASGMHLSTSNPDFWVTIQDVTGKETNEPGFYLDSLQIPADGQWLEYTNVPVVAINVELPDGSYLDGIIGMNLFVDLNFVIKGGGMGGQGYSPTLEFEPVSRIPGDIAGNCYQCKVDYHDLAAFTDAWLATYDPRTTNWNLNADMAPQPTPDKEIDFLDFAILANNWLETIP